MIRRDAFDSDLMGKRCGITDDYVRKDEWHRWDHLRVIIDISQTTPFQWPHLRNFEDQGFRLVTVRGTFEGTVMAMGTYDQARQPTPDEAEYILTKTYPLFNHSRFTWDRFYSANDFCKIHTAWLSRLHGERCLLVAGPLGAPRGFVGFSRTQEGPRTVLDIELISALDGKRGSGRHVLSSLVVEEKTHHVRAKTQLSNLPAVGLYHALGMKLTRTEAILTWSRE